MNIFSPCVPLISGHPVNFGMRREVHFCITLSFGLSSFEKRKYVFKQNVRRIYIQNITRRNPKKP